MLLGNWYYPRALEWIPFLGEVASRSSQFAPLLKTRELSIFFTLIPPFAYHLHLTSLAIYIDSISHSYPNVATIIRYYLYLVRKSNYDSYRVALVVFRWIH